MYLIPQWPILTDLTEAAAAGSDLVPGLPVDDHAHVVLGRDPLGCLHLPTQSHQHSRKLKKKGIKEDNR